MSQTTTTATSTSPVDISTLSLRGGNTHAGPLSLSGALDQFPHFDSTPPIGTEFDKSVQIADWFKDDVTEEERNKRIRDLAILVAQRGVVFFRAQDGLNIELQKKLGEKMGELTGKPKSSTLHVHPVTEEGSELGDEISVITSERLKAYEATEERSALASSGWHADITFEPVPSDYALLKMHTLPPTGGDTLWSSGYDAYDRLSAPFAKFLESLSALHEAYFFRLVASRLGHPLRTVPRGSPLNVGDSLEAVHPVIRTNPVTGWKTLFVNKCFTKRILGVSKDESDALLGYLSRHIAEHHASQVRFKWGKNDLAIWDNRSVYHTATYDYDPTVHKRVGDRVVSIGEAPYYDEKSKSRSDDLGLGRKNEGYY